MRKLFSTAALLTALALLAGCSSGTTAASIQKKGVLTVAMNATRPPFGFMDGSDFAGVDVEIAEAIADKLGVELKVDNMDFDAVLAALPDGKADLGISAISAKPGMEETLVFSDVYFTGAVVMLVAAGDDSLKTLDDLAGKKLGVQIGTPAEKLVESGIKGAEVVRAESVANSVQDLIDGKLDAALMDRSYAGVFAAQSADEIKLIDTPLSVEEYRIAAGRGNDELIAVVNDVLKELKESGKYAEIIGKYGLN